MDEIFALYHRPTVAREYATAEDFAAQVIGAEDTDGVDLDQLDAAARAFWREAIATATGEGKA